MHIGNRYSRKPFGTAMKRTRIVKTPAGTLSLLSLTSLQASAYVLEKEDPSPGFRFAQGTTNQRTCQIRERYSYS
jgi:hypothetical protein